MDICSKTDQDCSVSGNDYNAIIAMDDGRELRGFSSASPLVSDHEICHGARKHVEPRPGRAGLLVDEETRLNIRDIINSFPFPFSLFFSLFSSPSSKSKQSQPRPLFSFNNSNELPSHLSEVASALEMEHNRSPIGSFLLVIPSSLR